MKHSAAALAAITAAGLLAPLLLLSDLPASAASAASSSGGGGGGGGGGLRRTSPPRPSSDSADGPHRDVTREAAPSISKYDDEEDGGPPRIEAASARRRRAAAAAHDRGRSIPASSGGGRHLTSGSAADPGMFSPLGCNSDVDSACADDAVPLSALITAAIEGGSELVIPCGRCAVSDYAAATVRPVYEIPRGINVVGKLLFPSESSVVTLRVPHVFVQGVLEVEAPPGGIKVPDSTNSYGVEFVMTGTDDDEKMLTPHEDNALACSETVEDPDGCRVGKKAFVVAGGRVDINGIDPECPSWERLIGFDPPNTITVSPEAASCWGPGAELLITSNTFHDSAHRHVVVIDSVDPHTGAVTLDRDVSQTTSLEDSEDYAVEVALLSRNVRFVGDDDGDVDDDPLHGGHFKVLRTPGVAQNVRGVEVVNFGQQGNLGHYPIHFHLSHDIDGTTVKKNVIRGSNQRCIVIHGSHNITVEGNVAFDNVGHCYVLEDGSETGNVFRRNLAAGIESMPEESVTKLSEQGGREETDGDAACFWITNCRNEWYGNVAAGCSHFGYWIEAHPTVRGPSAAGNEDVKPMNLPLLAFKDNVAHTCGTHIGHGGLSVYPPFYYPSEESVVENFRTYRNYGSGMFLHTAKNMKFTGGLVADNLLVGIRMNRADNMVFNGTKIVGMSEDLIDRVRPSTAGGEACPNFDVYGMSLHPELDTGGPRGPTLIDVDFSRFDPEATTCALSSAAFTVEYDQVHHQFDAPALFRGVTVEAGATVIEGCVSKGESGMDDVIIEDVTGTLNPSGDGAPGFLVMDGMTAFAGDRCVTLGDGTCFSYCEGTCLRTYRFVVSAAESTVDYTMSVTDGTTTLEVGRRGGSTRDVTRDAYFGVSVPSGTYDVSFKDGDGDDAWPEYAVLEELDPPTCEHEATMNLIKPDPTPERCGDDLVRNEDFESGHIDEWQELFARVELAPTEGEDSSGAIKTDGRGYVTQWLDVSCLTTGDTYKITASYRVVDELGANAEFDLNTRMVVAIYNGGGKPMGDNRMRVAETVQPYVTGQGWNTMQGSFTVTQEAAAAQQLRMEIIFDSGDHIILDNVKFVRDDAAAALVAGCRSTVTRVDYSPGSTLALSAGGSAAIFAHDDDTTDGYLRVTGRSKLQGPKIEVDMSCMLPGHAYILKGRARLTTADASNPPRCTIEGQEMLGSSYYCLRARVNQLSDGTKNIDLGGQSPGQAHFIHQGEWFEFSIPLKPLQEDRLQPVSGQYIYLWQPISVAGTDSVDIDLDWVDISLPAGVDGTPGCNGNDLVISNGNAEADAVSPWPFSSPSTGNHLSVETEVGEDGTTNSFFRAHRFESKNVMQYTFPPGCLQADVAYTIKLRWRLNADYPSGLRFKFSWLKQSDNRWGRLWFSQTSNASPRLCPSATVAGDWTDCEISWTPTANMLDAKTYTLLLYPEKGDEPTPRVPIDITDFSITKDEASNIRKT